MPFDIATGYLLHRSNRLALVPRLGMDAIDIATSSITQGDAYASAARLGIPLSIEAGVRRGPGGFVVPATNLVITAAIRRRRGLSTRHMTMGSQVVSVLAGALIQNYLEHERRIIEIRHDEITAARREQARLAGQNDVAVGADTVVDLLIRTAPILQSVDTSSSSVQGMLSSWKAVLCAETSEHATYLKTALAQWQRRHNFQPDLSRDVEFATDPDDGTVLLSAGQVVELEQILECMSLRGEVPVEVIHERSAHLPGDSLYLRLGSARVTIGPDRRAMPPRLDLGPAALWLGAALCVVPALPTQGRADWHRVLLSVGWFTGAGFWSRRQLNRRGALVHERIFLSCVAGSLLQAVTTTAAVRRPMDENGWIRQSYMWPLFAEIPLILLYGPSLKRSTKVMAMAFTLATVCLGIRSSRSGWKDVVFNLPWPIATFLTFRGLAQNLASEAATFAASLESKEDASVTSAFRSGQRQVLDLVADTNRQLRDSLASCGRQLRAQDRDEAERRLDEVSRRLRNLQLSSGITGDSDDW